MTETRRRWVEKNRDKVREYGRKYRKNNKDKIKEHTKKWVEANRDHLRRYARDYHSKNRDEINERALKLYHKNKDRYNESKKRSYQDDMNYKTKVDYYKRINKVIRRYIDSDHKCKFVKSELDDVLGCSKIEFINHLISFIPSDKTLKECYKRGNWEIDHILPCFMFDLTDKKQLRLCFNYRNMRLLKKSDNLNRSRKRKGGE